MLTPQGGVLVANSPEEGVGMDALLGGWARPFRARRKVDKVPSSRMGGQMERALQASGSLGLDQGPY